MKATKRHGRAKVINNLRIGEPDTTVAAPSHVPGVHQGNKRGNIAKQKGIELKNGGARGTAARSTGINAKARDPIDPRMPNLSPS